MKTISPEQRQLVLDVRNERPQGPALAVLEKDLIAADAVALVADMSGQIFPRACAAPLEMVFCGGTCLSHAYGMIERISEDVDFKVIVPADASRAQQGKALSALKGAMLQRMQDAGFSLVPGSLVARNENRYKATNPWRLGI